MLCQKCGLKESFFDSKVQPHGFQYDFCKDCVIEPFKNKATSEQCHGCDEFFTRNTPVCPHRNYNPPTTQQQQQTPERLHPIHLILDEETEVPMVPEHVPVKLEIQHLKRKSPVLSCAALSCGGDEVNKNFEKRSKSAKKGHITRRQNELKEAGIITNNNIQNYFIRKNND